MDKITVWTKQHRSVLETLEQSGRYTARRRFVSMDLEECSDLVMEVYDWLVTHTPSAAARPSDAEYPVWVSFRRDAAMMSDKNSVLLELELDRALITPIHVSKWGAILNYAYLPADEADRRRHQAELAARGLSDAKAYMSRFYPELRREIRESWTRLFDPRITLDGSTLEYGTIWELRKEWIIRVLS